MTNNPLFRNIERLGDAYKKKHLEKWKINRLETDWWYATDFIFSHSFMRGRVDTVSMKYYNFTKIVLGELFEINNDCPAPISNLKKYKEDFLQYSKLQKLKSSKKTNIIGKEKINEFKKEFKNNVVIDKLVTPRGMKELRGAKDICLENDKDLLMVMSYFNFITSNNIENIYTYTKKMIKENNIKKVYEELDSVSNIGDKIATFIIRDIGLLNEGLINDDYEYAIPVDTWVMQISNKIGSNIDGSLTDKKRNELKKFLIGICHENNIDPLRFAAGLWVLGYHSLDLVMKNYLEKERSEEFTL